MWVQLESAPKSVVREILARVRGRAKFLVDESLGIDVAPLISEAGYNAKFAADVGLTGRSDNEVFAFAWANRRVLLTHDRDFLDDDAFPFYRNPSVVVLPGAQGASNSLVAALGKVLSVLGNYKNLYPNAKVEVSHDNTWNIRYFEKGSGHARNMRLRFGDHGKVWQWEDTA
jgi:predicted nuclease of predicted toxin-antitoxin system